MKKIWKSRILLFIFVIPLLLISIHPHTGANGSFSKIWTNTDGSKLKITISPASANYEPTRIYDYLITFEAIAFASNQDRFHQIEVTLRFLNAIQTFQSETKGYYELTSIGAQIPITAQLVIPSAETFSLGLGESLEGQLQYSMTYKEGLSLAIDPTLTSNWDTIVNGKITNPFPFLIIVGGIGIIVLISGLSIFFIRQRRSKSSRSTQQYFTPKQTAEPTIPPSKPATMHPKRFCTNCGNEISSTEKFCANCGSKL